MVVLGALAAGCGSATGGGNGSHGTTETTRPPDAFITARGVRTKMATGSYCWTAHRGSQSMTACADGVGWSSYPGMPRVTAVTGDRVTVWLGFTPTKPIEVDYARRSTFIPPSTTPTITVPGSGVLSVVAHGPPGDVNYAVRIGPNSR